MLGGALLTAPMLPLAGAAGNCAMTMATISDQHPDAGGCCDLCDGDSRTGGCWTACFSSCMMPSVAGTAATMPRAMESVPAAEACKGHPLAPEPGPPRASPGSESASPV